MNNDPKLKLAMAQLLPDKIHYYECMPMCDKTHPKAELVNTSWRYHSGTYTFLWIDTELYDYNWQEILETEWLYVMHLIEQTLTDTQMYNYFLALCNVREGGVYQMTAATFNQRATAMCKLKGITL